MEMYAELEVSISELQEENYIKWISVTDSHLLQYTFPFILLWFYLILSDTIYQNTM